MVAFSPPQANYMKIKELLQLLFPASKRGDTVLFRVDAGRKRGLSFGHLSRCAILADGLKEAGVAAEFVMFETTEGMEYARSLGLTVVPYDTEDFRARCAEASAVVFDLPWGLPEADMAAACDARPRVVVIDDTNRKVNHAHAVLNTSVLAQADNYTAEADLFLGPRYFFLPPQYESVTKTAGSATARPRVLFTFGGSDPTGLTERVLLALADEPDMGAELLVVLGPGFGGVAKARELCAKLPTPCDILHAPDDLLSCFLQSELVVTSGGRTLYELHVLEVPTIAIASIDHEADAIAAFAERGMLVAGLEQWDAYGFVRALKEYVSNSMEGVDAHSGSGRPAHR